MKYLFTIAPFYLALNVAIVFLSPCFHKPHIFLSMCNFGNNLDFIFYRHLYFHKKVYLEILKAMEIVSVLIANESHYL